jgi:2-polyprenyl-3-methyl-5-hydroxy-6-metoxy-1,4-benzoquinol methylase
VTDVRFGFGENWKSFVATALDQRRITFATNALRRMLRVEQLYGKTFLDIGSGSGLSSLAACMLGAERVVSFDYDQHSVEATMALRARAGITPAHWSVSQGSILDEAFLATLPPADVVYSWGVLHHTGAMWQAIDNAAALVQPGGLFAIAIYNNVEQRLGGSRMWWQIKHRYVHSSQPVQRLIEAAYTANFAARSLLSLRNPLATIRRYDKENPRGMDFWHDMRDWVGGFPYEYATAGELFNRIHERHGLELIYLNNHDGHICNELTFRRPAGGV